MKKFAAILLAMLLAVAGFAYAEPVVENEPAYTLVRFFTEATETAPATESLALLGAGNGEDAFTLHGLDDAEYADSFAALWQNVAALQPAASIEGEFESIIFTTALDEAAQVEKTIIVMNGETVLEVEGLAAFAVLPEALGEIVPQIAEDCDAYIWLPEGLYEAAEICPNCGEEMIGDSHTTKISVFCDDDHTQCMGNPIHECDGCGRSYECSASNSHTECIKCGKLWCYKAKGDHKETKCGHRGCEIYGEEEKHEKCVACGKYLCNGKDHKLAACGKHHANEAGNHAAAACGNAGHYNCDGKNHTEASCGYGHTNCDGQDHAATQACGHNACLGEHAQQGCGHYACAEGDHVQAGCGHFLCIETEVDHEELACGHYACAEGDHSKQACGHYACAGEHGTQACGHYECAGEHAQQGCGHYSCQDGNHKQAGCGHWICISGEHTQAGCGHYSCAEGEHELCSCGGFKCIGEHNSDACDA